MLMIKGALSAVVGLLTILTPAYAAAQSIPPPTLTGETLHAQHGTVPGGNIGTITFSTPSCGPNATIHYSITGIATGPYPGTFSESGKIVLGSGTGEFGEEPFPI